MSMSDTLANTPVGMCIDIVIDIVCKFCGNESEVTLENLEVTGEAKIVAGKLVAIFAVRKEQKVCCSTYKVGDTMWIHPTDWPYVAIPGDVTLFDPEKFIRK